MSHNNKNNTFKLPICYDTQVCSLSDQIQTDLELTECINTTDNAIQDDNKSVYDTIFKNTNIITNSHIKQIVKQITSTYTTNIDYLKDTQQLILKYNPIEHESVVHHTQETGSMTITDITAYDYNYDKLISFTKELLLPNVLNKYGLIDYHHIRFLNNYEHILQFSALYTICSPIIALATPFIILIVPFILLKIQSVDINFQTYIQILKQIGHTNPFIRMFTDFMNCSNEQKTYQTITVLLYLFSIYQQCMNCCLFYTNIQLLNNYLINLKTFVNSSLSHMRHYVSFTSKLTTYNAFNIVLSNNINDLLDIQHLLEPITIFNLSVNKFFQIGYISKVAYILYSTKQIQETIDYAIHFNAYYEIFESIVGLYKQQKIHVAKFVKNKKPILKFKKMYYPSYLWTDNYVSNNVNLQKHFIITGPNASGKTTVLKSIFINTLFTQQFGVGFYSTGVLTPFKYLHCYLNIPDTNGRDSLFQAEARRCKEIIDNVQNNKDGKHFAIFDELYSGTNPDEAVSSSYAVLKYITTFPNVKWILTTHFYDLCKLLDKQKSIQNTHMEVTENFKYTYLLKPKMSKIKGAHKILKDMDYPIEVLSNNTFSL
jgi:hypothetical protein